jgi:hypothetical protein
LIGDIGEEQKRWRIHARVLAAFALPLDRAMIIGQRAQLAKGSERALLQPTANRLHEQMSLERRE